MKQPAPTCPRCGYDQSGAVAAWTDQCPTRGVCPERGLDFAWVVIFRPNLHDVRGFFEHARTVRQHLWWSLTTLPLVLTPNRFWRRISLDVPPRPCRSLLWIVLLLGTLWLSSALLALVPAVVEYASVPLPGYVRSTPEDRLWGSISGGFLAPIARHTLVWGGGVVYRIAPPRWYLAYLPLLLLSLCWPFMLAMLSTRLTAAKIRAGHITRATAYSLFWLIFLLVPFFLRSGRDALDAAHALFTGREFERWYYNPFNLHDATVTKAFLLLAGATVVIWLPVWWWFALSRGFLLRPVATLWAVIMLVYTLLLIVLTIQLILLFAPQLFAG